MSRSILAFGTATLWCVAAAAGSTTAPATFEFHSADGGYTLTLPADWVRIPPDEVQSRAANATTGPAIPGGFTVDAAFQPDFLRRWFSYPHVIVTTIAYASAGLNQPVTDEQIERLANDSSGAEMSKMLDHYASSGGSSSASGTRLGRVQYDRAAGRMTLHRSVINSRLGAIRTEAVLHFGRDAIVEVSTATLEDDWHRYGPVGQAVANSLRFDPGRGRPVSPAPASPAAASPANSVFAGIAGGSVAGLVLIGSTIVALRMRRRRRDREDPELVDGMDPT